MTSASSSYQRWFFCHFRLAKAQQQHRLFSTREQNSSLCSTAQAHNAQVLKCRMESSIGPTALSATSRELSWFAHHFPMPYRTPALKWRVMTPIETCLCGDLKLKEIKLPVGSTGHTGKFGTKAGLQQDSLSPSAESTNLRSIYCALRANVDIHKKPLPLV